ncbi:MAG: hypothetical protein JSR82_22100 [Verrucomicrobia bacterium]|nr:hypothetical protein [Verrucomicrobiota bacterium]
MDFLSTGLQEFGRRLRRQKLRRSLGQARKRLAQAESDLGALTLPTLAGRAELPPEVEQARRKALELDGEIERTSAAIVELEAELASIRGRENAAVRAAEERTASSQADEAALRQQQLELRKGAETSAALGVPGKTAFVNLHEAEKSAAQAAAEAQQSRRTAVTEATRSVAEIHQRLVPLRLDLARLRQAQRQPLRELGAVLGRFESLAPAEAGLALERRREALRQINSLEERLEGLKHLSSAADPQNVRLSIFLFVSLATIVGLTLLLIFRAPPSRDWLPADSQIVSAFHLPRLQAAGAANRESAWNAVWRDAADTLGPYPTLAGPAPEVRRVVIALGESKGDAGSLYRLVEMNGAAADVIAGLNEKHGFGMRYDSKSLGGLGIAERNAATACAQIGYSTLALGETASVSQMIRVRLGLAPDLKIEELFFTKFQRLDRGSAIRLITRQPRELVTASGEPIIAPDLAERSGLLGIAAYPGDPIVLVLLFGTKNDAASNRLAAFFAEAPARHLRLQGAGAEANILAIEQRDSSLECRLTLNEAAAREFLPRLGGARLQRQ